MVGGISSATSSANVRQSWIWTHFTERIAIINSKWRCGIPKQQHAALGPCRCRLERRLILGVFGLRHQSAKFQLCVCMHLFLENRCIDRIYIYNVYIYIYIYVMYIYIMYIYNVYIYIYNVYIYIMYIYIMYIYIMYIYIYAHIYYD